MPSTRSCTPSVPSLHKCQSASVPSSGNPKNFGMAYKSTATSARYAKKPPALQNTCKPQSHSSPAKTKTILTRKSSATHAALTYVLVVWGGMASALAAFYAAVSRASAQNLSRRLLPKATNHATTSTGGSYTTGGGNGVSPIFHAFSFRGHWMRGNRVKKHKNMVNWTGVTPKQNNNSTRLNWNQDKVSNASLRPLPAMQARRRKKAFLKPHFGGAFLFVSLASPFG
ncbi:Unannotated [Lentimonas sp. CC4]|nr:Unannotated [Lentimonas sp. CC4]CAA6686281.1 Unannotated [Lentimonas sp. CC6]CAA7074309.1 Unannotated [Lentimonas sp. CC4]CAA7171140.1 Unannotated [Lentimonas sp. CC21]CAA7180098.1 Unannotated [Lentimonas sp. CC8]